MGLKRTCSRRAFSPVISAIIISAVVLAVGGAVWAFSQGVMTITAEGYAEAVVNMTETISERFIIENVKYDSDMGKLYVWLYNYGKVDIIVDVYADVDEGGSGSSPNYEIPSGAFEKAEIILTLSSGNEVAIKVVSRRGNNVFYKYIMP